MKQLPKAVCCWEDRRVASSADEVKRQADKLVEEGFSYVIPISDYIQLSPGDWPFPGRDPLRELTTHLKGSGVKTHAWQCVAIREPNGPLLKGRDDLRARWNDNGVARIYGGDDGALCMAQPEVQAFKLEIFRRMCSEYEVDGVMLDFIRWIEHGNTTDVVTHQETFDACVCDHCRAQVRRLTGEDLLEIARRPGAPAWKAWLRWRTETVTGFVERLRAQCRLSGHCISAAVFSGYPRWPFLVGQDWKAWVDRGLIDIAFPMDYHEDPEIIRDHTIGNARMCAGKAELWPIIMVRWPGYHDTTPDELRRKLEAVRDSHADGVGFFCWEPMTEKDFAVIRDF